MKPSRFYLFILASLALHGAALILFLNSGDLKSFFRKNKQTAVPLSVRVDMAALPDLKAPKARPKANKEKPVLIPKKKPKTKPKKKLKKPEAPKKRASKPPSKNPPLKEEDLDKTPRPETQPRAEEKQISKGNRLAEGAKEGKEILDSQTMSEINIYLTEATIQIRSHWNLPKYLADLDLKVQIEIRIGAKGNIISAGIAASSGNELFDSFALKAVEGAAPYSPPPGGIRSLIRDGIVFVLSSKN